MNETLKLDLILMFPFSFFRDCIFKTNSFILSNNPENYVNLISNTFEYLYFVGSKVNINIAGNRFKMKKIDMSIIRPKEVNISHNFFEEKINTNENMVVEENIDNIIKKFIEVDIQHKKAFISKNIFRKLFLQFYG